MLIAIKAWRADLVREMTCARGRIGTEEGVRRMKRNVWLSLGGVTVMVEAVSAITVQTVFAPTSNNLYLVYCLRHFELTGWVFSFRHAGRCKNGANTATKVGLDNSAAGDASASDLASVSSGDENNSGGPRPYKKSKATPEK